MCRIAQESQTCCHCAGAAQDAHEPCVIPWGSLIIINNRQPAAEEQAACWLRTQAQISAVRFPDNKAAVMREQP